MKLQMPYPPMEATPAAEMPKGDEWWYEPKWDGFRCIAFRKGKQIDLQSKAGKPLTRYFPEIVRALENLPKGDFVLDGELVIRSGVGLSFDALLQRIHPAASRIAKLSTETPASYIIFDLLRSPGGELLVERPLRERRAALERFYTTSAKGTSLPILLSPVATAVSETAKWLKKAGSSLDGIIAKRVDASYGSGTRDAMTKVKFKRSADCVVGGFRYGSKQSKTKQRVAGSLLLGLYDDKGVLNHVGFTTILHFDDLAAVTKKLEKLKAATSFTGRAPGGPSRWSTERSSEWQAVKPTLVVEVEFDHFSEDRFRHGTRFLRWRPDKAPKQCVDAQVRRESGAIVLVMSPKKVSSSSQQVTSKKADPSKAKTSPSKAKSSPAKTRPQRKRTSVDRLKNT